MTVDFGIRAGAACNLGVSPDRVSAFYASHWRRPIALGLESFYLWQFRDAPAADGRDRACVAIDSDGALVGVMGLNPRPFILDGEHLAGAELTTWIVSPEARGKGVGKAIMRSLQDSYEVLLGGGITNDAQSIYLTSGFDFIRYLPRFYRIHDVDALVDVGLVECNALGRRLVEQCLGRPAVARWSVDRVGVDVLADCGTAMMQDFNLFIRDAAHLGWRYADHPVFDYSFHHVTSPAVPGPGLGLVLRETEVAGQRVVHVVDFLGDAALLPSATAFLDEFCRSVGAMAVDVTCVSQRVRAYLRESGWFSAVDEPHLQFAHLFNPPELRTPPTTSLMMWTRSRMRALADHSRLHFAKGDLDLDRPTIDYIEHSRQIPAAGRRNA
ncbi:GNAT family N-acetyltransferase [Arenibaculum sp.]|jgi:GNAT superfamily N-acetyltransferase|uniref:GNAT family N-acetyltransferase n=1 Tax=Arenibaculum sp. TaxID=2865862 RepID=UPI002E10D111|nr:GNAT family N-acetyltransferase [Arenibaculum sp.]